MHADIDQAREGRERMKLRCEAIAAKYFAQVSQLGSAVHRDRRSLTGRACIKNDVRIIEAPRPGTRRALYVFLHECAHHLLGHLTDRRPTHVHELEAERWAHTAMRAEGLAVPKKETQLAKIYVATKIGRALKRGAKFIDPEAAAFAGVNAANSSATKQDRPKRSRNIDKRVNDGND
jgi:hypothetical protein